MRPSRKRELGRYLTSCKWSTLDHLKTCEEKLELFTDLISLGINIIMPNKGIVLHVNDPLWITANFKNLIKKNGKLHFLTATTNCSGIIATESIAKEKYVVKSSTRRRLNI